MAIEVSCPGCAHPLRVSDDHAGKRAKCPFCETKFEIPGAAGSAPPQVASGEPAPAPPGTTGESQWGGAAPGSAGPGSSANPYQSPPTSPVYSPPTSQPQPQDVPGIIGVVLGGLALLFDVTGCCCGFLTVLSFLIAIAGLITSFFGKGNLKIIGLALNAAALVIAVIWVIIIIVMIIADM